MIGRSKLVTSSPMRPEDDQQFLNIHNSVIGENGKPLDEAIIVMANLNISMKDVQNKTFEKFL